MRNLAVSAISTRVSDRGEAWELSARLGKVQPNATVWGAEFWIGSPLPREVILAARVYADNIPEKTEVALRVAIKVEQGWLTRRYDDA